MRGCCRTTTTTTTIAIGRFPKSQSSSGGRLYQKSIIANANLVMRLPVPDEEETPPSSPERFMTPNQTMSLSTIAAAAGLDDSDILFRPTAMINKINNNDNNNSFATPPQSSKSASQVSHKSVFNYSDEEQQRMLMDQSPPTTIARMKRMKSLGNLPLFQRDFGGTPQDIVRMRRDFEAHRFGMARMKSMTDLMEIPQAESPVSSKMHQQTDRSSGNDSDQRSFPRSVARDSIFKRNTTNLSSSGNKQRIGVGDTKFIGNPFDFDRSMLDSNKNGGRKLSKNKSMGMIPDLLAERGGRYDIFFTPAAGNNLDMSNDQSPSDEEDEGLGENLMDVTSYEHFNVILRNRRGYQVSEPGGTRSPDEMSRPFERGYRRSYMKMSSVSPQSPQMMLRQSDGWYSQQQQQQQQYSPVGTAGQYPWTTKMHRYQRQESVEERLMVPVFAYDRNNNNQNNSIGSHNLKRRTAARTEDQEDEEEDLRMVMASSKNTNHNQWKRHSTNASSCCSSSSSRVVVNKLNQLSLSATAPSSALMLPLPKRCVSAEPVTAKRGRSSVERYAMISVIIMKKWENRHCFVHLRQL